ncbi:efflux RND transporter periplasmic adaptor subunit [Marinobacterium arenosum]|uniref:efflux RND transporter periplasmic adaptor subunit n=1 Tax=Marinobacterium arenosum TaxID=2862496 RepID=UPI001C9497C5|nr:efflux RND transporter periplasmic adaptor subunit [Marinobacterium arenosum]MBY4677520.1 efflux RND transporter periplasmic adaptor subunit [Marinobacterium arenosum]
MRSRWLPFSLLTLLTLLAGVVQAASVRVAPLYSLVSPVEYSAPARVVADDHSILSAQISGLVEQVMVRVGDQVESGQPLVLLECSDYRLALNQAESSRLSLQAQIRLARAQLARAEKLLKQRNAPEELRDQRQAELDRLLADRQGADLQIDNARLAVQRCSVSAPFAGVVTERPATEGSLANPGTPLIKLLRSDRIELSAELPLAQVGSLQRSPQLNFVNHGHDYPLSLRAVLPLVDSRTRTREVRLRFTDQPALAGSSGRLIWQAAEPRLPVALVVKRDGQLGVMLYQDGKARFQPLPGALEGQAAPVDLPPDSRVIVEGQHAVNDGDAVELKE